VENRATQRRARVVLTSAALLVLTISGHTAGGGSVDLLGLALVAGLSLGLGLTTSASTLSLARLLVILLAGQGLLHLVLTFTSGHAAHGSTHLPVTAMLAGHAVAALAAALIVRHADGLVVRWLAFVSTMLGVQPRPIVRATGTPSSSVAPASATLHQLGALLHQVVRRGPPAGTHLLPA
jgi:hypothetical protein